jgi:hypothetical protein
MLPGQRSFAGGRAATATDFISTSIATAAPCAAAVVGVRVVVVVSVPAVDSSSIILHQPTLSRFISQIKSHEKRKKSKQNPA